MANGDLALEENLFEIATAAPAFIIGGAAGLAGALLGGGPMDWLSSALQLLGDIVDPILPGFAGSELRPTSRKVSLAAINAQRAAAGLAPIGGRRRRKRALTKSDREDIGFIAGMISKAAARDFAMIVAGGR